MVQSSTLKNKVTDWEFESKAGGWSIRMRLVNAKVEFCLLEFTQAEIAPKGTPKEETISEQKIRIRPDLARASLEHLVRAVGDLIEDIDRLVPEQIET